MLSAAEIRQHVERLTYKPGWAVSVYEGRWEGTHVVIRALLPDSTESGASTVLDIHSMLPPVQDVWQFEQWLAWRLGRIEIHEMREFLKRDGVPIFDPHAPDAEHDTR